MGEITDAVNILKKYNNSFKNADASGDKDAHKKVLEARQTLYKNNVNWRSNLVMQYAAQKEQNEESKTEETKSDKELNTEYSESLITGICHAIKFTNMPMTQGNSETDLIPGYIPYYGNFDLRRTLQALVRNSKGETQHECATYVRMALEAGGMSTAGRPLAAWDYRFFLPKKGFKNIAVLNGQAKQKEFTKSQALPGDIAVMPHGQYGHICMWTGAIWCSDFRQTRMRPYNDDGPALIFRFQQS